MRWTPGTADEGVGKHRARLAACHSLQAIRIQAMNLPGFDHRKRRLPILLACVIVLQTMAGVPGFAADEGGEAAVDGAGSPPSSALVLDSDSDLAEHAASVVDDECREPCDLAQCDCAFCCQGNQQSVLHDFVGVNAPPASRWSITSLQSPSSRIHPTIHRPPIA